MDEEAKENDGERLRIYLETEKIQNQIHEQSEIVFGKIMSSNVTSPRGIEQEIKSLSRYNLIEWSLSIGHSVATMQCLMGYYYGALLNGQPYWIQHQRNRRICLSLNIGCGIASAIHYNKLQNPLKVSMLWSPYFLRALPIPLIMLGIEYYGGVKFAKYGVIALAISQLFAKMRDNYQMDYLSAQSRYFQKTNKQLERQKKTYYDFVKHTISSLSSQANSDHAASQ